MNLFSVALKRGGDNCIKVYFRGQIAKIHLHFETPKKLKYFRKNLNEIDTLLQLHFNLR